MNEEFSDKKEINYIDIAKFYKHVISTWKPSYQVWAFEHGDDLTIGAGVASGLYITHFFRKELKLRPYARLTCYSPVVGITAISCYVFQSHAINASVIVDNSCPLCIIAKSSLFQLAFGLFYPITMAGLVSFHLADRLLTYPVPSLTKAPKEVYHLWLRIIQKNPRPLYIFAAAQVLSSWLVTQQKLSFMRLYQSQNQLN